MSKRGKEQVRRSACGDVGFQMVVQEWGKIESGLRSQQLVDWQSATAEAMRMMSSYGAAVVDYSHAVRFQQVLQHFPNMNFRRFYR